MHDEKPLNKVAIPLWVLALVTIALNSVEIWTATHGMAALRGGYGEVDFGWASIAHSISAVLSQFALLFGLGMLIEIADRALWHLKNSN